MKVRITAGRGVGQIVDLIPAVAKARIAGGTAVAIEEERETAALEPRSARGAAPRKRKASVAK
jgi:hypothetical protein